MNINYLIDHLNSNLGRVPYYTNVIDCKRGTLVTIGNYKGEWITILFGGVAKEKEYDYVTVYYNSNINGTCYLNDCMETEHFVTMLQLALNNHIDMESIDVSKWLRFEETYDNYEDLFKCIKELYNVGY